MRSPKRKRILFVFFIAATLSAVVYIVWFSGFILNRTGGEELSTEQQPAEQESVFEPSVKTYLMPPVRITIKDRNISADVIEVGLTEDSFLDTPKKWTEAGWYKKSAKPGEDGNVIINAHFDDNYGRPAAFYQLKNATVGDTVLLEDSLGRLHAYQIVDSSLVDINDPDRLKVLESREGKSELTLITCGGVWLQGMSTYDKRLVVKAELINSF